MADVIFISTPSGEEMSSQERELLAEVFFQEGRGLILQGENYAFNVFDIARRISPKCARLQFQQGLFLFDYAIHKGKEKYLLLAQKHVQEAIDIEPNYFDAWYILGDILVHLGLVYRGANYFLQAHEKYKRACTLCTERPALLKKFLWDWALCWYFLGKHSGEAIDIKKAIEKFQKASELGCNEAAFWRDFGNAWAEMGLLIEDARFLQKALTYFQKAIQINPKYFEGWLSLAHTFQYLYQQLGNEQFLAQAHSAYAKASDFKRDRIELWISWGSLFLTSGRLKGEIKHLQMSTMKFAKALKLNPEHAEAMSRWGEALIILGNHTGRLDHLKQAEKKILRALELMPESANIWYRYGFCLYAQGQYFVDSDYYLMALEKFNRALTINENHFFALNGIGLAQYALGDIHQDITLLRKANDYFQQASELKKDYPELWNNWGMIFMSLVDLTDEQEDIEEAVEKFEEAIGLYETSQPSTQLLYNYGCALDLLGSFSDDPSHYEKSIKVLQWVLKIDSDYTAVHYNLALVYSHLAEISADVDDYGRAIEQFHLAVQDDSEDETIWCAWAMTLINLAQLINEPMKQELYNKLMEEAEKKLRQAIALGNLEGFYNLCCYHSLMGNMEEAMYYLHLAQSKETLPDIEQLLYDDRIESLRRYPDFQEFLHTTAFKGKFEEK